MLGSLRARRPTLHLCIPTLQSYPFPVRQLLAAWGNSLADLRLPVSRIVTTCLASPIRIARIQLIPRLELQALAATAKLLRLLPSLVLSAPRSIPPHSNALYVLRDLPARTIFAPTCALTPTSVHLCAVSAAKHSLVNMTANDTKVYTAARRNLSVEVLSKMEIRGVARDALRAQMLLVVTLGVKPDACASGHC